MQQIFGIAGNVDTIIDTVTNVRLAIDQKFAMPVRVVIKIDAITNCVMQC